MMDVFLTLAVLDAFTLRTAWFELPGDGERTHKLGCQLAGLDPERQFGG